MTWGFTVDDTHDVRRRSWVSSANDPLSPFPIQSLAMGVFRRKGIDEEWRVGVAIGDEVLDVRTCVSVDLLQGALAGACSKSSLNPLLDLGAEAWMELRHKLSGLLCEGSAAEKRADDILVPGDAIELGLPVQVGDYSDFFASIHHARRTGKIVRGAEDVSPNFRWLPIAYHGRASSIVVSGTPVSRPLGVRVLQGEKDPTFGKSAQLDFELELAAILGGGNPIGSRIPIEQAHRHVFGICLMNDWSARDLQRFEATPLGPFLGKSFATSLSAWVIPMGALAPFRMPLEARAEGDPAPLPHLSLPDPSKAGIALNLYADLLTHRSAARGEGPARIVRTHFKHQYWSFEQALTHQTSNGCNIRSGDLLGSGTVSGPAEDAAACLLEVTEAGRKPLALNGETRTFLEDGDEIILTGQCLREGYRTIELGTCRGRVEPALNF